MKDVKGMVEIARRSPPEEEPTLPPEHERWGYRSSYKDLVCPHCGVKFKTAHPRKKFCTTEHQELYWREIRKQQWRKRNG